MSPKLYNIYIAGLVDEILKLNEGICLINIKISIILYADDILLICNSRIGLIKIFNVTNEYMEEWKIVINWTKTYYIVKGKPVIQIPEMIINGNIVERVKQMKYLGFIIDETFSTIKHKKSKNKTLMKQTYALYNTGLLGRSMDTTSKSFTDRVWFMV